MDGGLGVCVCVCVCEVCEVLKVTQSSVINTATAHQQVVATWADLKDPACLEEGREVPIGLPMGHVTAWISPDPDIVCEVPD